MRLTTIAVAALLALGASVALAACGGSDETVSGAFEPLSGAPASYSEVAGEATLERSEGGTEASIELSGLPADTEYVAHVHAAGCDQPDPGGPHFKFDAEGSDMPPNEIHFALTTNADGEGEAEASNEQRIPDGDAGSIVVHSTEEGGQGGAMRHDDPMNGNSMQQGEGGGHSHSDKIACAELEGGSAAASGEGAGGHGESMEEGDTMPGDSMKHEGEGAMKHEGDSSKDGEGSVATIVVRNGKPVGGVHELRFDAGRQVRFRVRSDVADEVHVHGYDLSKDVAAGGTVAFSFPADIEGIFEVELEERVEQIAELRVEP